ncbi:ATP-dependent DNA ligase [Candidatus Micrarchaeota archaeon]|nr:ATP-dependent DNA ligase [Candidatus Micrarchaeota archaeon]
MLFIELASAFGEIEKRSGRLEMTDLLSAIYKKAKVNEIKKLTYLVQGIIAPSYEGIDLGMGEKFAIEAVAHATGYSRKDIEKDYRKAGDLGLVAESLLKKKKQQALHARELSVSDVFDAMMRIAKSSGTGSQQLKIRVLAELINNSSPEEGKFIVRFVTGQLRLGIGDPTILDALSVSKAGDKSLRAELERAYNLCDDLGLVAETFVSSPNKIKKFEVEVFKPVRPALAERLATPEEIIKKIGECAIEFKFDGFRMQVHKKGEKVEIYSRKLEKITNTYPDVVEATRKLKHREMIFEGEALAFNEKKNRFFSFQETMHRRRKYGVEQAKKDYPLYVYAFDLIYLDGKDYTQESYSERRKQMEKIFPSGLLKISEKMAAKDAEEIEEIFQESVKKGLEGIMAKDLKAPYVAGARKFAWIKLKKSYGKSVDTVDAVVVGYYLGKGARAEFEFGGILAAVYNPDRQKFETVAKIGSGYSEEEMKSFHEMLSEIKRKEAPSIVDSNLKPDFWVELKYVVEVAFDDITLSPTHTCGAKDGKGYALRFPRMMRLRSDRDAREITTTQEVIEMYELMKGK